MHEVHAVEHHPGGRSRPTRTQHESRVDPADRHGDPRRGRGVAAEDPRSSTSSSRRRIDTSRVRGVRSATAAVHRRPGRGHATSRSPTRPSARRTRSASSSSRTCTRSTSFSRLAEQAREIADRATPGNFEDLAKRYSIEPGVGQTGGDLGYAAGVVVRPHVHAGGARAEAGRDLRARADAVRLPRDPAGLGREGSAGAGPDPAPARAGPHGVRGLVRRPAAAADIDVNPRYGRLNPKRSSWSRSARHRPRRRPLRRPRRDPSTPRPATPKPAPRRADREGPSRARSAIRTQTSSEGRCRPPRGGERLLDLVRVMATLRGPDGCPWDHEQTHRTLGRHLLEEAHEALEAIDAGDDDALRDELGDVLLQVVFHAQIAADDRAWDVDDVADAIVTQADPPSSACVRRRRGLGRRRSADELGADQGG